MGGAQQTIGKNTPGLEKPANKIKNYYNGGNIMKQIFICLFLVAALAGCGRWRLQINDNNNNVARSDHRYRPIPRH